MFTRHYRKVKLLFGLTDILVITFAFGAAYETRLRLQIEHNFYLSQLTIALLLGVSALSWIAVGRWFEIYDRVETADARTIVRDAFQQCAIATVAVVLLEYLLRFDLSRLFLAFFALYSWFLLSLFRLNARRLLGIARHEFGRLHFVMIV
ncbi:MAG: sugar transferase, partial [Bryobacteraceae bacterium]